MVFLNLIKESILFALHALSVNKLRTFLSLLGITIGIFAIVSVFTVVDSLERNLRNSVASLGDNVIYIQKWPWAFEPDYPWWKYINRPLPSLEELDEIQRKCKTAEASAFTVDLNKTIKYRSSIIENVNIVGASHDFDKIKTFELAQGRYFTEMESISGKGIVIIGNTIAEALFKNVDPLGKFIKIWGRNAMVVGVFEKEGESILGETMDNQVLLPVNFVRNMVDLRNDKVVDPYIMVKANPGISNEELMDELTGLMRSIRKLSPLEDDNFALNQTSLISNQFDSLFEVVGMAGWIIGGFSILVGGFGIANIMFVSVRERTHIIGIQKSLGAKNYFILLQFLFESVFLCLIGGVIGLLVIFIGTWIVGDSFGMEVLLTKSNVILGLTISVLIGVISGFIPSYGASQLDPVEAIRMN